MCPRVLINRNATLISNNAYGVIPELPYSLTA